MTFTLNQNPQTACDDLNAMKAKTDALGAVVATGADAPAAREVVGAIPMIQFYSVQQMAPQGTVSANVVIGSPIPNSPTNTVWAAGMYRCVVNGANAGRIHQVQADGTSPVAADVTGTFVRIVQSTIPSDPTRFYGRQNGVITLNITPAAMFSNAMTHYTGSAQENLGVIVNKYRTPQPLVGMSITPEASGTINCVIGQSPKVFQTPYYSRTGLATIDGKWADVVAFTASNNRVTGIHLGDLEGALALSFAGNTGITSFQAPSLRYAGGLSLLAATLTTIDLSELIVCHGALTLVHSIAINLPKLEYVSAAISLNAEHVSLPELLHAPNSTVLNSYLSGGTVSAPKLQTLGTLSLASVNVPVQSYPALKTIINGIGVSGPYCTTLSLPALEFIASGLGSNTDAILVNSTATGVTSLSFPSLKQVGLNGQGHSVTITAPIDQTSVDAILVKLASLDGSNGYQSFDGRTVTINGSAAAPSATGLAAKATLVARGCTVANN